MSGLPGGGEPVAELAPTRVGGGRAPRLIALGLVALLGGVVYLGVAGRPAGPVGTPAPAATPVAPAVAIDRPASSPAQPARVAELDGGISGQRPYPYLGTSLRVAGDQSLAVLREVDPGYLYAAYRIPFPRPAREATLEVANFGSEYEGTQRYGRWHISLDPLAPETRLTGTVLDTAQAPLAAAVADLGAPDLLRNGYRIRVRVESRLSFGVLAVEIRVGQPPQVPDEGYQIATTLGRRHFVAPFRPTGDFGRWVATIVLPDSVPLRELPFRLRAVPASDPLRGRVTVGSWPVLLPPPREFGADATLLDEVVPSASIGGAQAQISANGFRLVARSSAARGDRFVEFELTIEPRIDPLFEQSLTEESDA